MAVAIALTFPALAAPGARAAEPALTPQAAATLVERATLWASGGGSGSLGYSVAISGDTIVVGAPSENFNAGAAYVFEKPAAGWATMVEVAKLTASNGEPSDNFGYSVAIAGDTIVVGQQDMSAGRGSAYVFVKPAGGWVSTTETAKLTASDGASSDFFGTTVAVAADTIVVGAFGHDVNGSVDRGSAYLFVRPSSGWATGTESARLTASDGAEADWFGISVAIDGDTIVIGAAGANVGALDDRGAAYVFTKPASGWATGTETAKLIASEGEMNDFFGSSVAISGDTVVVGAVFARIGANRPGAAYIFDKPAGGWSPTPHSAKLIASDREADDHFGGSVAIAGLTIVVGAEQHTVGTHWQQGTAYVFTKALAQAGAWVETTNVTAADGAPWDSFGRSVALSASTIVVGAFGHDAGTYESQGVAYVFAPQAANQELLDAIDTRASQGAVDAMAAAVDSRASQASVTALATSVGDLGAAIASRASQASVDSLGLSLSAIGGGVTSRASQSSVDAVAENLKSLDVPVSTRASQATAEEILAKIAQPHDGSAAVMALTMRLAVERALADGAVVVSFFLPASLNGQLELVRQVVNDAIAAANAAGINTAKSIAQLAEGDQAFGTGRYRAAYQSYARAYGSLVK